MYFVSFGNDRSRASHSIELAQLRPLHPDLVHSGCGVSFSGITSYPLIIILIIHNS